MSVGFGRRQLSDTKERSMIQYFPLTFGFAGLVLAITVVMATTAAAQDVSDLQTTKPPLVLQGQGSFFVGGDLINAAAGDLGAGLVGKPQFNAISSRRIRSWCGEPDRSDSSVSEARFFLEPSRLS